MADVTITPRLNGPYRVDGPITLVDVDGNAFDTGSSPVFLCRRGGSANKPFCDGTHKQIGFQAATKAVQEAVEQWR